MNFCELVLFIVRFILFNGKWLIENDFFRTGCIEWRIANSKVWSAVIRLDFIKNYFWDLLPILSDAFRLYAAITFCQSKLYNKDHYMCGL